MDSREREENLQRKEIFAALKILTMETFSIPATSVCHQQDFSLWCCLLFGVNALQYALQQMINGGTIYTNTEWFH